MSDCLINNTYFSIQGRNKRDTAIEVKEESPLMNGYESHQQPEKVIEKPTKPSSPAKKEAAAPQHHKEKKSNDTGKEKANKKKKNEIDLVQNLVNERDGISVDFLIPVLNQAELTRNEIQFIIDFLLNKQQDTLVDHSEWSEGRGDVLIKIKKQLNEKEKSLQEEQENGLALQKKINDLRNDITAQRLQFNVTIKSQAEEINMKKLEIQNLTSEIQYIKDKFNADKQTMSVQLQQLKGKLIQEKNTNSPELLSQLQQLTETNAALNSEVAGKNSLITELKEQFQQHQFQINDETMKKMSEYENKYAEYEHLFRLKDQELHALRQRLQELTSREADFVAINEENQRLRVDLLHKEDIEGRLKKKQFENEQLKQQIEQQTKASHHDDANKVEIRNLQNALDSSIKESNECKKIIEDLNGQINDLQSSVHSYSAKSTEHLKQVSTYIFGILNYIFKIVIS